MGLEAVRASAIPFLYEARDGTLDLSWRPRHSGSRVRSARDLTIPRKPVEGTKGNERPKQGLRWPALTHRCEPHAPAWRHPDSLLRRGNPGGQRRGRDSNPRWTEPPIPVFETGAFNRSATSPVELDRLVRRARGGPEACISRQIQPRGRGSTCTARIRCSTRQA